VLGSPMAWAGHLVASYSLEEWFACSRSASERGEVLGMGVDKVALIINGAMAALAAVSMLSAVSCRRRLKQANGDETTTRARWMALAGIVEGALFLGIILFGFVPPLVVDICESTP
jgi:hypothetical protein